MRWSNTLIPTLKETPADAVAPSHILLLRAGMIRQLGAGAYTYLPLGLRVLHKASRIVRQEMNAAGAIELLMPALQPVEIWNGHRAGSPRVIAHPGLPLIQTCGFPASGSSSHVAARLSMPWTTRAFGSA